jgi:hypothetical protein
MSAVIHMVKPHKANVFGDYTQKQLLPFLQSQMTNNLTRIDACWDTYQDESLKSQTRTRRETLGQRTTDLANIPMAKGADWHKFLKEPHKKDHLIQFVSKQLVQETTGTRYHILTTRTTFTHQLTNQPTSESVSSVTMPTRRN